MRQTPLHRRIFDLVLVLVIAPVVLSLIGAISLCLLVLDGRPIFFPNDRMRAPGRRFRHLKFRTMRPDSGDAGVTGADKTNRITPLGAWLRRTRLDELPQWWNVMRGDMSFVGPRPPLPVYVERFPELYAKVLSDTPGITGMATLAYHRTEERLLAQCATAQETDEVYARRCIPRKARLDILYARRRTLCSDIRLIVATVVRRMPLH